MKTRTHGTLDSGWTRREALGMLGAGAGLGLVSAGCGGTAGAAHAIQFTSAEAPDFMSGAVIRTLGGDVDPRDLANGATLIHEHLRGGTVDQVLYEVDAAGADGVACLVDSATGRRDQQAIDDLQAVADRTDVHIVRAGGYFQDIGFSIYPVDVAEASEDELFEQLVQDAAEQRWGGFRRDRLVAGDAAGRAQGAPRHRPRARRDRPADLHPHAARELPELRDGPDGRDGVGRRRLLPSRHRPHVDHQAGGRPDRHALGHSAPRRVRRSGHRRPPDEPLADPGDRQGADGAGPCSTPGFEDHIVFSSDMGNRNHWKANYGLGYSTVLMQFVPKLLYAGVPEAAVRKILVDNPRRFLAVAPKA